MRIVVKRPQPQMRPARPGERRTLSMGDRKSVVEGKRGGLGGGRIIKKKKWIAPWEAEHVVCVQSKEQGRVETGEHRGCCVPVREDWPTSAEYRPIPHGGRNATNHGRAK